MKRHKLSKKQPIATKYMIEVIHTSEAREGEVDYLYRDSVSEYKKVINESPPGCHLRVFRLSYKLIKDVRK